MIKKKQVIVISDVHIQNSEDDLNFSKLLDFLSRLKSQETSHLVILGDLFDFCFGRSNYFRAKYKELGDKLNALAQEGIRLIYIQGNHEFSMEKIGWEKVEFFCQNSFKLNLDSGIKIAFMHGDKLIAPWHYHLYMAFVRSWFFQFSASFFPGQWMDRICLYFAKLSRSAQSTKRLSKNKLFDAAKKMVTH